MNSFLSLSLITSLLILSSCSINPCGNNKRAFLNNFSTFVEDVKAADRKYSDVQWEDMDRRFRKFTDECFPEYKEQLSDKESEAFYSDAMAYAWARYGRGFINEIGGDPGKFLNNLFEGQDINIDLDIDGDDIDNAVDQIKNALDGIDGEKLENLLEEAGDDIENWGKKLEEIFEDIDEN
ncbi:MAG: DUF6565 domain-containing protein [Bacteroidota bacterium]